MESVTDYVEMLKIEPLKSIHWKEIKGYKFQTKPIALMLSNTGYRLNLKFGNRRRADMQWNQVTFDSEYVSAYFDYHFKDIFNSKEEHIRTKLNILLSKYLKDINPI